MKRFILITITADDGSFDSGTMEEREEYKRNLRLRELSKTHAISMLT